MKRIHQNLTQLPTEDYSVALRKAVEWLGDRYVLAVPVKAQTAAQTGAAFFATSRPWNTRRRYRPY